VLHTRREPRREERRDREGCQALSVDSGATGTDDNTKEGPKNEKHLRDDERSFEAVFNLIRGARASVAIRV
jgi:hypothetical protein